MDLLKIVLTVSVLFTFGCAKNLPYELKASPPVAALGQGEFVVTSVETLDGVKLPLPSPAFDYRILIFSSDACQIVEKKRICCKLTSEILL
ncbi:MAG: hypothetical protein V4736_06110 [Bdellovibrionota bacterium]